MFSFDDDEQLPAVSADAAFSFDNQSSASPAPRSKSKSKSQLLAKDDPEPAKSSKRGSYRSNSGGGGIGKLLIASVVFALIVGAVVGGVLIYLNSKDKPDQVNNEKKEPPPTPPIEAPPVPKSDGKGVEPSTPKGGEKTNPKKESGGEKTNPKKEPGGKKTPGANSGAMLGLAPGRTISVVPMATKRENVGEPTNRLVIVPTLPGKVDASFALARKVFPPLKQQIDIGVLWQTDPGFQNRGEKLLLGIYSPQTGRQQNQVAFEGDGSPVPACDLSVSADLFAHAHTAVLIDFQFNIIFQIAFPAESLRLPAWTRVRRRAG